MNIPRRHFLQMLGVAAGAAGTGCTLWSVPDDLVQAAARGPGIETEARTVCGLCPSGCGVTVRQVDGIPVGIRGNPHYPLNRGGVCPVGHAGLDLLYSPDRLRRPLRRDSGQLVETSWEEALELVESRLAGLLDRGHADRIALIHGEPGIPFNDLARQFAHSLGSPHIAGPDDPEAFAYELCQGVNTAPAFDLTNSDLVLAFGFDPFSEGPAPLHAIAALVGARSSERKARLLRVSTRNSPGGAGAEQRVAVRPGTHGAFALGVAHVLVREGRYDRRFVQERCLGFEDWTDDSGRTHVGFRRILLERYYPDRVAELCGCETQRIADVARRFHSADAPLAMAGGEAVGSSNGTWTAMAVHSLNALVGAFNREGGVVATSPAPFTPMPEVEVPEGSPFRAPGPLASRALDPWSGLADGLLDGSTPIEVLFVIGSNPIHERAAGDRVREALEGIPLVVAVTPFLDETSEHATVVLPRSLFLESWQATTPPAMVGFEALGVARPVLPPLHESRHPGDVLLDLGRRLLPDSPALPWNSWEEYVLDRVGGLAESGEGAIVTGSFDEAWAHFLEDRGWRFQQHRSAGAFREELLRHAGWWNPAAAGADWTRVLRTPSGRFEFYSQRLQSQLQEMGAASGDVPAGSVDALLEGAVALGLSADIDELCLPHFEPPVVRGRGEITLVPFRPLTARGDLGIQSRMILEMFGYSVLSGWETWAEIAPETAHELGVADGDTVALESEAGSIEVAVKIIPGTVPGTVHVPFGLGRSTAGGPADGVGANPLAVSLQVPDPVSRRWASTSTRVAVRLVRRRAHGAPPPAEVEHLT